MSRADEARERDRAEARVRIARILETGRWPSGWCLSIAERRLLTTNARKEGLL